MIVYCLEVLKLTGIKSKFTEPLVAHAERQTLIRSTVQTARACLVGVFEFTGNSDLIRIDE